MCLHPSSMLFCRVFPNLLFYCCCCSAKLFDTSNPFHFALGFVLLSQFSREILYFAHIEKKNNRRRWTTESSLNELCVICSWHRKWEFVFVLRLSFSSFCGVVCIPFVSFASNIVYVSLPCQPKGKNGCDSFFLLPHVCTKYTQTYCSIFHNKLTCTNRVNASLLSIV